MLMEWLKQSVKNPVFEEADVSVFGARLAIFCVVRFVLIGVYNRRFRGVPCVLDLVGKYVSDDEKLRRKFYENAWYTVWHTTSTLWAFSLLCKEGWFWDIVVDYKHELYWTGWKYQTMPPGIKDYYLWASAFWGSCLVFIFLEVIRKDFGQMLLHHIATLGLLLMSFAWNYWRIGTMVLLLHDTGDIFLYAAKASKGIVPSIVTDFIFVLFVVAFFSLRLVAYPILCVAPPYLIGFCDMHVVCTPDAYVFQSRDFDRTLQAERTGFYTLPTLLLVLQVLHVFWFVMIMRIVYLIVVKNVAADDIRSDDEEEEEVSTTQASPAKGTASPSELKKTK